MSETTSNAAGAFTLAVKTAGTYKVLVAATSGFGEQTVQVRVSSSVAALVIKMLPEALNQSVEVKNDDLTTDAAANKDAVVISGNDLKRLPVFDQDYLSALVPFLDPGSGSAGGITITVNGVEMKHSTVSASAIAEVRINNDPYSAEFSRPGRGRVDIITKPGSPEYHGEFNFITRDARLNATNRFATSRVPEQRRIFEGHITGPVGHGGHTTFLASGSYRTDDAFAAILATPVSAAATVLTPSRAGQIAAEIDHDFSKSHRVSIGYNFEPDSHQLGGVGGLTLAEAGSNNHAREDDLIFNDRYIFSPNLFNQFQVTLEKDEDVTRSATDAARVIVLGSFTRGGAQAEISRTENTIHINEVVSWTKGRHYLRFGANIPQLSRRAADDHTNRLGTFEYRNLADFQANKPRVYTVQQGTGRGIYWINEIGAFVQDQFTVRKNLQLNLGLRYQWQTYISSLNSFAPRVGIAWSVSPRTVLRAGTGIFYDRTGGDFPSNLKLHDGILIRQVQVLDPAFTSPPPAGQAFAGLPSDIIREDPRLHAPYTIQYSATVERKLSAAVTLTAGYRGIRGISSFRSRDANAPVGPNYSVRPNPNLGVFQQIESGGRQTTNALDIALRGKTRRWLNGQAQYTLGRTYTNTEGLNFFAQDQYAPNDEWSRSTSDRLHRFNILGNINPDHWLTLGIAAALYSGSPYTQLAGLDRYNTGLSNDRPVGVARNTLQGSGTANLDVLWDHNFYLTKDKSDDAMLVNFGVSAFNVLNHPNLLNYVGLLTSSRYGTPTTASSGRQLQLSARYQF